MSVAFYDKVRNVIKRNPHGRGALLQGEMRAAVIDRVASVTEVEFIHGGVELVVRFEFVEQRCRLIFFFVEAGEGDADR